MDRRYELFELPARGFPRRLSAKLDLETARAKLDGLPARDSGNGYLIRDCHTGRVVVYKAPPSVTGSGAKPA